jgi:hypothetical protein
MENARFIEVSAEVRYWEDGTLNGKEDTAGEIPLRRGDNWEPIIELHTGQILDWPQGVEASVHYKVCDAGEYWLLNENRERIAKWKGHYVPDAVLCAGSRGHGDYIIFTVSADGKIVKWAPRLDEERWGLLGAKA